MSMSFSDKFWATKSWWCQPWSIVLTGVTILAFSWLCFHKVLITSLLSLPVLFWWFLFLVVAPTSYNSE